MRMMIIYRRSPGTAGLRLHTPLFLPATVLGPAAGGSCGGCKVPHASLPTGIQCLFASHGAGATTRHHHPLPPESCQAQDTTPPPRTSQKSTARCQGRGQWGVITGTLYRCPRERCQGGGRAEAGETPRGELPGSGKGDLSCKERFGEPCKGTAKEVSLMLGGWWEEKVWAGPLPHGYGDAAAS